MNSTDTLREFREIIHKDPLTLDFCNNEQKWIADRERDWKSDRLRVGVIGVTSSGKSTLVNTILGKEVLSSAVVPSSGQLVCCSYGKSAEVLICFQDGKIKRLSGDAFTQEKLQHYSDERYNPGNKKEVLSIELSTPTFDLGEDILLIDSPGLDAYGLEAHEKLTLESLVPTIDACIYVTTTKQNTDRKTKTVLDSVAKYNCPIIIVQNMLDSVKPSAGGDKTREQVAAEHRCRVKRIVDNTAISDKNTVKIIQMSAKYATQWRCHPAVRTEEDQRRYRESNYEEFAASVKIILERQRPRIECQRLNSIRGQIAELYKAVEDKINVPAQQIDRTFPLAEFKKEFQEEVQCFRERNAQVFARYFATSKEILKTLGENGENNDITLGTCSPSKMFSDILKTIRTSVHPKTLEECVRGTNAAVSAMGEELQQLMSDCTVTIKNAADKINIPHRDLLRSASIPTHRNIYVEQKIEKRSHRVKKTSGPFGGNVARLFGDLFGTDWGYTYEVRDEMVVDAEATRKNIVDRLGSAWARYMKTMEDWFRNSFDQAVDKIMRDLDVKEAAYNRQREAAIQTEALIQLRGSLLGLLERLEKEMPIHQENENLHDLPGSLPFQGEKRKIEISAYSKALLELSQHALQTQHRRFFRAFIEKIGCMEHLPLIISWDTSSREGFLWQSGIADALTLSPEGETKLPYDPAGRCVFVLVNTTQFGEAMKQIAALRLDRCLTDKDYVIWVVQDFQELLNGGHASEGLDEMGTLAERTGIPCESMIYVRHENPLYSWALLELQKDPGLAKNPHFLIQDIQKKYPVYTEASLEKTMARLLTTVHMVKN